MSATRLVIIGGGLAGLSAGCYARANDFDVTLIEHNLALGGVCTAWQRGPYLVDGCIHWLTGGPFTRIYEELGIIPPVRLHVLDEWMRYRHAKDGWEISVQRNLATMFDALRDLAPEDADELSRMWEGAERIADLQPPIEHAPEVTGLTAQLRQLWEMRGLARDFVHFTEPMSAWADKHLKSPRLRGMFRRMMPPEAPPFFLLMLLGYLARGWLSRPLGGTAAFRDALIARYQSLGGRSMIDTTVEEIIVRDDRARGVRLTDGTMIEADVVISTSSVPETVFRLLAGRYGAHEWKARIDHLRMFQPIVLATYGVARPLTGQPSTLIADAIEPLAVGDRRNDSLYLRLYNDDPSFAPPGHAIVQAMVETSYEWWATRGARYQHEKEAAGDAILTSIDRLVPGVRDDLRMVDLATPLTYWRMARSWRGAFEGWLPKSLNVTYVPKTLPGLADFYMAGQWVEPGGGVPMATMSGRHVIENLCAAHQRPFRAGSESRLTPATAT
ncbi:MAG TPA: NAD(P)/FAD-dependent oxidoreductase [Candidatus Eisenbacteria bacterium]|nr:NAD(P)/FAD-dependent oxidoreductase [Candidatus Eisenbacteria bacterium]